MSRRRFATLAHTLAGSTVHEVDCVVCGGGIAGVATAMHLAERGVKVCVVDPRGVLTLTSLMSTEGYRDIWSHPAMCELVSHSISLMENVAAISKNVFGMSRRGYLFCARTEEMENRLRNWANDMAKHTSVREVHSLAGSLYDPGTEPGPQSIERIRQITGIDIFAGNDIVHQAFPYLSKEVRFAMHGRRCGYLGAQQYGAKMWEIAKEHGAEFVRGSVVGVSKESSTSSEINSVYISGGKEIRCKSVVNSSGPFLAAVNDLFVEHGAHRIHTKNEQHAKVILKDVLKAVPRTAPMVIGMDEQYLPWGDLGGESEVKEFLKSEEQHRIASGDKNGALFLQKLASSLPGGCHTRPWGNDSLLCLWEWVHASRQIPKPPPFDPPPTEPLYADVLFRGLSNYIPAFWGYVTGTTETSGAISAIDGGFYTQSSDNLPMIGPAAGSLSNYFICGALSGYGIMTSNAAGELTTAYIKQFLSSQSKINTCLSLECRNAVSPKRYTSEQDWFEVKKGEEGQI